MKNLRRSVSDGGASEMVAPPGNGEEREKWRNRINWAATLEKLTRYAMLRCKQQRNAGADSRLTRDDFEDAVQEVVIEAFEHPEKVPDECKDDFGALLRILCYRFDKKMIDAYRRERYSAAFDDESAGGESLAFDEEDLHLARLTLQRYLACIAAQSAYDALVIILCNICGSTASAAAKTYLPALASELPLDEAITSEAEFFTEMNRREIARQLRDERGNRKRWTPEGVKRAHARVMKTLRSMARDDEMWENKRKNGGEKNIFNPHVPFLRDETTIRYKHSALRKRS